MLLRLQESGKDHGLTDSSKKHELKTLRAQINHFFTIPWTVSPSPWHLLEKTAQITDIVPKLADIMRMKHQRAPDLLLFQKILITVRRIFGYSENAFQDRLLFLIRYCLIHGRSVYPKTDHSQSLKTLSPHGISESVKWLSFYSIVAFKDDVLIKVYNTGPCFLTR